MCSKFFWLKGDNFLFLCLRSQNTASDNLNEINLFFFFFSPSSAGSFVREYLGKRLNINKNEKDEVAIIQLDYIFILYNNK